MKRYFLPKAFDLDINDNYCSDYQIGKSQTSTHWHSGAEIIFIINGSADVLFNNAWHKLKENSMLFVPPGQLHCCRCNDATTEKIVMGFTEKCLGKSGIGLSLPPEVNQRCILHNLQNTPIPQLLKEFDAHCKNNDFYNEELLAKSVLFQVYAFMISYWASFGLNINERSRNKISYALYEYIESHYTEDVSPYTVAKEFNMSYSALAKKMQETGNTSFTKAVNHVRVENAKKLLAVTDKNITEIGFECGFSTTSYFIKNFKQLTGMTPKAYRQLVKLAK